MTASTTTPLGAFARALGTDIDFHAPDYDLLRQRSDDIVPFGKHVGTVITAVTPDEAVVEIGGERSGQNHMGTVHAGAIYTAADIAGAAAFVGAAATRLARVERLVLRSATATYRKPATGVLTTIAAVDKRELAPILAATTDGRHELTAKAGVHNADGVVVAKFGFDYVVDLIDIDAQADA